MCTGAQQYCQCSISLVESQLDSLLLKLILKTIYGTVCFVSLQIIIMHGDCKDNRVEVMSCVRFEHIWSYFHLCNLDHQVPRGQMRYNENCRLDYPGGLKQLLTDEYQIYNYFVGDHAPLSTLTR